MRTVLLLAIAALMLAGCDRMDQKVPLAILPEQIECPSEGGEFEIKVEGPWDWVTDNTAQWIDIRKRDGYALVSIEPDKGADRERNIRFHSGNEEVFLKIIQSGAYVFSISETGIETDYKGGSHTITVECYEPWTASCDSGWIHMDIGEGNEPSEMTISIDRNYNKESRTASVWFKCGTMSIELSVTQGPGPYIALEKETVEIDGDGGTMNVLYLSNTDVEICTEDSWIRLIGGLEGQKKVAFEVLRNLSEERNGNIVIKSTADPECYKILTVIQGSKIDHPAMHFEEGYSMEISENESFILHPVFTDMTNLSLSWTSSNPEIASVSDNGTVTIHTSGTCTITASNHFHDVSASISLNIRLGAVSMRIMLDSQDMEANPLAVRFPGEKLKVIPVIEPANAYIGDIVCISSDPAVASVDGMTINCLTPGTANISVESLYHGIRKSFSILILED